MRNMKLAATAAGLTGQVLPALFRVHAHVHAVHGPRQDYPRVVCHVANPVRAERRTTRDVFMSLDMHPLLHASRHRMRGVPMNIYIYHLHLEVPMQCQAAPPRLVSNRIATSLCCPGSDSLPDFSTIADKLPRKMVFPFSYTSNKPLVPIDVTLPVMDEDAHKAHAFYAEEIAKEAIATAKSSPAPMAQPSESWIPKFVMTPLQNVLRFWTPISRYLVTSTTTGLSGEKLIAKGPFPRKPSDPKRVVPGMQYYNGPSAVACVKGALDKVLPPKIAEATTYQAFETKNFWSFMRGKSLDNIKVRPSLTSSQLTLCPLTLSPLTRTHAPPHQVRVTLSPDCKPHDLALALIKLQKKGGPGAHFTIDREGQLSRPANLHLEIPGVHIEDKDKAPLSTKVAVMLHEPQQQRTGASKFERYRKVYPHRTQVIPKITHAIPPILHTKPPLAPRVVESLSTFGLAFTIQETLKIMLERNGYFAAGDLKNLVKDLPSDSPHSTIISNLVSAWSKACEDHMTIVAVAKALELELTDSIKASESEMSDSSLRTPEEITLELNNATTTYDAAMATKLETLQKLVIATTKALIDHPNLIHPPLQWYETLMASDPLLNIMNFAQIKDDKFSFTLTFTSEATKTLFEAALPLTLLHPSFSLSFAPLKIIPIADTYRICIKITAGSVRDIAYLRAVISSLLKILVLSDTSLVQQAITGIKKANAAHLNDTVGRGGLILINTITGETINASELSEEDTLAVLSGKHGRPLTSMFRDQFSDIHLCLHLGSKASLATCVAFCHIPFDVINPINMQPWGKKVEILPYETIHNPSAATVPKGFEYDPLAPDSDSSKKCLMMNLRKSYSIATGKPLVAATAELNSISKSQSKPFASMTKAVGSLLVTCKDPLLSLPVSGKTDATLGPWTNISGDDDWDTYVPVTSPAATMRPPPSPSTADKERALMAELETDPPQDTVAPPRMGDNNSKKPIPKVTHPYKLLLPISALPPQHRSLDYVTHAYAYRPAEASQPRLQKRATSAQHQWMSKEINLVPRLPPRLQPRNCRLSRRRRRRRHCRALTMARKLASDRLKLKILYTLRYRRWGQTLRMRKQIHRLTSRFYKFLGLHRSPQPTSATRKNSNQANILTHCSSPQNTIQHHTAQHCTCHAKPQAYNHTESQQQPQPPPTICNEHKSQREPHESPTDAIRTGNVCTSSPVIGIATKTRCSRVEYGTSRVLRTIYAPIDTFPNLFHTPMTTGAGAARQNERNAHPVSFDTHPATQNATPSDLHLTVSLIPNEESGSITIKLTAPTHAVHNLLPKGACAHEGTGIGVIMGGAGCMYSAAETREMDHALLTHGLRADWGYQWVEGDCGFDSLSSLSGVPSITIRNNAMDILSARLANRSEDTTNIKGFIQEMIYEHKERGGCEYLNDRNYIANMRKGARAGGLWMDNLVAGLAGETLEANIEIYEYADGSVTAQGGSAQKPQWPTYRLLYTRGPPGHFTPLSWHPTPTTVHTQPNHPYPSHSAPHLAVQRHRLPDAVRQFWEKQDRRFCWLHAFNMARKACMDQDAIPPHEIIQWFTKEQRSPRYQHHHTILNDTNPDSRPFDPLSGNFNQCAFAFWAFLTQLTRINHVPLPPCPSPGLNVDSLIPFLTQTLVNLQHNNESTLPAFILSTRENAGYGHATTLIYEDSTWYWLDSDPTKLYRAILTGPAAEPNRQELLTVARCLYSIDHGAHDLQDCPLACVQFDPNPPTPWQLPPIVAPDSPISTTGTDRAQPHAGARSHAGAHDLSSLGQPSMAVQVTDGATITAGSIALPMEAARHRGTDIVTIPSTKTSRRSKNRPNRSKSALEVTKTVAKQTTDKIKQKKQKMITSFFHLPSRQVPSPTPHPLPPPPPQPPTPTPEPKDAALTLLQINAQGSLWTMQEDLIHLKELHSPDIIGICDIGLKGKNKRGKWLIGALQGYQYWAACHTNPEGRATHGVLLAVKDHIAKLCNPTTSAIDTCQGRLLHITLRPPHSQPLGISEVYAPAGNTPQDNSQRKVLYNLITQVTQADSENHGPTYQIHTGDWNATLFPSDRTSHTTYEKDTIHRDYVTSNHLSSTDDTPPRAHTYHHTNASSRIDDTLTNFRCETHTYINDEGELSDHTPLLTSIHLRGTNLFIPQARPLPPPPPNKTVVRPISQEDQVAFQQAIQSYTSGQVNQIQSLHRELKHITTDTIAPYYASIDSHSGKASNRLQTIQGENAAAVIERLSSKLLTIGSDAHTLMLETCKTKMTNPSGKHYEKRGVNKKRRKLNKCLQEFRQLHREIASAGVNTIHTVTNLVDSKPDISPETKNRWLTTIEANNDSTNPSQMASELMSTAKADLRRDIKALDKDKNMTSLQQAIDQTRRLIDTRPKQANRNMRRGNQPQNKYPAFFDPTVKHCTDDPNRMSSIVTDYFTQALSAPPQGKNGRYLPSEAPRDYPWEKGTDNFKLETHATRLAARPQLHTRINDPTVFEECFRTLSNGKAPGPDGVENELLKMMPREYKECIHMLLAAMWATGITPDNWKESTTILLEKEGKDSTRIENNRPIGLLNTIYKLWTKLITRAIYDYAEQYGILSTSQKGFRKFSNTMDQLQMFIMALEDARLTGQNIYKIQVDFSKAFEMIDHDKMLTILYDLGLPTDAIDVVRDLYTGASTRVKWGATGITAPISQKRGTIQGDSLSPLLFTLTLEPLLRWLSTGGRGYMFGCLAEDPEAQLRNSTSGIAFADDLDILTNNLSNTKIQAEKLSRYSDWANMCVNQGKTEVSAMLYQDLATAPKQRGGNHKRMYQQIKAQLYDQIMIQNKHIKFKDPRAPFTYLGAELTMTLDWKYQVQALVKKAHDRVTALMAVHASPRQVAHNIRTTIIPALANAIGITPCNKSDIHLLDSILTQAAKRGHGIPAFGPTAMTHEDRESGGLEIPSMMVSYTVKHSQLLIESLNNTGRQGAITRALLNLQLRLIGDDKVTVEEAKYCLRLRQLALCHNNDLDIIKDDVEQFRTNPQIVQSLMRLNPINKDTPWTHSTHFLQPLLCLGITDLRDLLEPGGKHIIDGRTLRLQLGRRKVKAKHIAALNRLSCIASQPPGTDNDIHSILRTHNANPLVPRSERRIHPRNEHMTLLDTNPVPDTITHPVLHPEQRLITQFLTRHIHANRAAQTPHPTPHTPPLRPNTVGDPPPAGNILTLETHVTAAPQHRKRKPSKEPLLPKKRDPAPKVPRPQSRYDSHNHKEATARLTHDRYLDKNKSKYHHQAPAPPTWKAKAAAAVIDLMYGHTGQIEEITGWRMVNDSAPQGKRRRSPTPNPHASDAQTQFQVSWADTIIEPWALSYFESAGYKALSSKEITRDDLADKELSPLHWVCTASCEICFSPHSLKYPDEEDRHDDILLCSSCLRSFHNICVGDRNLHHHPDLGWQCPACLISPPTEGDKVLLKIKWQPTWENPDTLSCSREGATAFTDWIQRNHNQPPIRTGATTLDSHLSNLTRQGGDETASTNWQTTMGDPIRTRITFEMEASNPQVDIHPLGECKIEIRQVDTWAPPSASDSHKRRLPSADGNTSPPDPSYTHNSVERACFYRADGRCQGTRSTERLIILKQLYDKAAALGFHAQLSPPPRSFEEEALDCIVRHTKRDKGKSAYEQLSLPPSIHSIIQDTFHTTKTHSATPWSVPDSSTPYWSPHPRDQIFGAQGTPYNTQWSGFSQTLISTPNEADAHIRWAVQSARHAPPETAVVTVILIARPLRAPRHQPHHKWLKSDPDLVTHVGNTSGAPFPFRIDGGWTRPVGPHSPNGSKHRSIEILVIWNQLGKDRVRAHTPTPSHLGGNIKDALLQLQRGCLFQLNTNIYADPPSSCPPRHPTIHKPPRAFKTTLSDHDTTWTMLPPTPPNEIMHHFSSDVSSLRHNWRSITYTDGSCQQTSLSSGDKMNTLGAGVYIPAHEPQVPPIDTQEGPSTTPHPARCITINPRGQGATNTINRAELSAVWGALDTLQDTAPLHADGCTHTIAPDSAASMYQIRRALLSPMDLRQHTHKPALSVILQSMRSLLSQDPSHRITFLKVKAHTGDIGNEIADRTADWATKHPDRCDLVLPADPDAQYKRLYWPHAKEIGPNGEERLRGLSDLTKDLHAHMHARNRLGTSNKYSFYFNAWQKLLPIMDGKISNKFLYNSAVTFAAQKTALNYRSGTLWSNNMAKKHRLRANSTCPLCPKDDGIGHMAGGCTHPTMERMYTERHNTIGRILLRAIAKGRYGACIIATDLGSASKSDDDGAPHVPYNTLPPDLQSILTNPLLPHETRSKPDAIIMIPPEQHIIDQRPTLLLLEFKTCRCTDPNHQLTHCQQQHQRLTERLSASYNVKLIPVLIGHSGAIYTKHTLQSMEQLGIDKEAALKCAGKMHIATVNQLHSIVQTRRHLEHASTPQPGRPPSTTTARTAHSGAHLHPGKRPKHRQGNHSFQPP